MLDSGTRLGVYEIISVLGAGGMGEVYLATDTTLGRKVAIKVLPDAFAQDTDRLARFEREAKTLATLNHPQIAQIYGLERSGGVRALVMEFVEGDDLSQRIARGAIPIDEALPIAKQIAEALEAAHEQGIIHRDLKPANIKVRSDGTVKVLDFGLAKAMDPAAAMSPGLSQSPTITTPAMMTGVGMILGTAAYMSPEQAKGRPADKRSDVWAFGCVLYQMFTGRRAFDGDEVADVLARVLEREPDFDLLPPATPSAVRRLLRRCLQKDRRGRLRDIGDALIELQEAGRESAEPLQLSQKRRTPIAWMFAAGMTTVTLILAVFLARRPPAAETPAMRFIVSSSEAYFDVGTRPSPTISPNGRFIAFLARRPGATSVSLWVRSLDSLDARELRGTDAASQPFWSPDSRYIGFATSTRLQKIEVSAGAPQTICTLPVGSDFLGATWNKEDTIVFGAGRGPLLRVAATGGPITPVTKINASRGEVSHRHPYFLPDGRHFLYLAGATVFAGSLDAAEPPKELVASDAKAIYAPPGYLLYVAQTDVLAQSFDVERLAVQGETVRVAEDVAVNVNQRLAAFSVSNTGTLVYRTGGAGLDTQLEWFDRAGKPLGLVGSRGQMTQFSLSPDDQRVAIERPVPGPEDDIWILELANGALTRLTFDAARKADPVWTPDGKAITYNKNRGGQTDLFQKVVGSSVETLLSEAPGNKGPDDWSPDGKLLLYQSRPSLFALATTGDRKPIKVADIPGYADEPHFSPDMRWIAYSSDESGQNEIYVASYPAFGGKRQVSVGGGAQPRWRRDGSELFYLNLDRMLMSVQMKTGVTLESEPPKMLFQTSVRSPTQDMYDVTRDGNRFLIGSSPTQDSDSDLMVLVNWLEELKRLVPTK